MDKMGKRVTPLLSGVALFALGVGLTPANAQELQEELEDEVEEVVVTGSRIKRSAFNSPSPVQIISGEVSREAGLFDVTEILQATSQTSGLQVNNSFNSFVLDNGLGASTVGFRGLGADRTLVLINGRRVAPAGVGGAPSAPDLNLIPAALIQRVENVFDGASAVYGSDAIAGVSNVILRSDVDGLEVYGSGSAPFTGGGEDYTVSALYGKTGDNWSFTAAASYYKRETYKFGDSDFFNACDEYRFETPTGDILTQYRGLAPGTTDSACRLNTINRVAIFDGIFGNVWSTPGESNIGIPNFSETIIGPGLAPFAPPGSITQIDSNGDGVLDPEFLIDPDQNGVSEIDLQNGFYNFDNSARAQEADLLAGIERITAYATGNYNFEDDNNTELYFEAMYSRRESDVFQPGTVFWPTVSPTNPFNITNPAGEGVNSLNWFGVDFGAFTARPYVVVRGDRDFNDVTVSQYRLVGGLRGNIGGLDNFLGGNWTYDSYVTYSKSSGTDTQTGIDEVLLNHSLDTTIEDPNNPGSYICGADGNGDGIPDGTDGCVPVNVFAPSLFAEGGGTFASQAETDYLMVTRAFETEIEQTLANGIIQGDLFDLPNGSSVPFLFGYEFRRDTIRSIPNDVAAEGRLFAFFADKGATGSRDLHEFFAETQLEVLKDSKFGEYLAFDLSGRLTDESDFDPHFTYSLKGIYRPVSHITLRGTYGTSYRAPNLRERFLEGTTGFRSEVDPCVVPTDARDVDDLSVPNAPETYLASEDTRSQTVLNACAAAGLDPTSLGLETGAGDGFLALQSIESTTGGSSELDPETSTTWTAGLVLEQPWTDAFDLKFSVTYFDIDIRGAVNTPTRLSILNGCYNDSNQPDATAADCGRITRDSTGQITFIDTSFQNIGQETAKGFDFNLYYQQEFEVGAKNLGVSLDLTATRMTESNEVNTNPITNEIVVDEFLGRPTLPKWRAGANLILDYADFRLNWYARWIQGGENEPDEFEDDFVPCDGLPTTCRPVYYTTNYSVHNVSLSYAWKDYTFNVGVRNVFDKAPPQVDPSGVFSTRNVPLGVGYDLVGRTAFMNISATF